MYDLWNSSDFWRILINILGVVSIIVAIYLMYISYKIFRNLLLGRKAKELKNIYAKIYELPIGFLKDDIQLGFEIPEEIHVRFTVLDNNEKEIYTLHDGKTDAGKHVFLFKTRNIENGQYYLNFKSEYQCINKKMIIQN